MNAYVEIKNTFQFFECAVRNNDRLDRCSLPKQFQGRQTDSVLRDYVFCLTLVSMVAKLENDIESLSGVPLLRSTDKLKPRLRVLKNHFAVSNELFEAIDRIREARNAFVHDGNVSVNAGCTKAELPGKIVSFLQCCRHPDYI